MSVQVDEWPWEDAPASLLCPRTPVGDVRRMNIRQREAVDYRAYCEARYDAADDATNGVMLSARGIARELSPRRSWFAGRMASTLYASEELRDWFAEYGPTLSVTEYRLQSRELAPDDPTPDVDPNDDLGELTDSADTRTARVCPIRRPFAPWWPTRRARAAYPRLLSAVTWQACHGRPDGSTALPRAG